MISRRGILVLASVALVGTYLLGVGCDGDNGEPAVVTTVVVTPSAASIDALGNTAQFTASARDQNGNTISGATFTWSSLSMSVATVNQSGLATAVGNGQTSIRATADGVNGSGTLTVAQVAATVVVTPDPNTLVFVGDQVQLSAAVEDANGNPIANATVTWSSEDDAIVDVDAAGLATAVFPGSVQITATSGAASDGATVTVNIRQRPVGDIVLYNDQDSWGNGEDLVLQDVPFNFVEGTDYLTRAMADMQTGIPSTTSLIVLPSVAGGDAQILAQNDAAAQAALDAWVRAGGWLAAHLADNSAEAYMIPGLTGTADDITECDGLTLVVADHALIRGPDATLGTGDDLTDTNIDLTDSCSDNHGSLDGILPANAEVLIIGEAGANRDVYATYALGAGRVIVSTITLECGATDQCQPTSGHLPILRNHYYWAINGLDAGPTPVAPMAASRARPPLATAGQGSHR